MAVAHFNNSFPFLTALAPFAHSVVHATLRVWVGVSMCTCWTVAVRIQSRIWTLSMCLTAKSTSTYAHTHTHLGTPAQDPLRQPFKKKNLKKKHLSELKLGAIAAAFPARTMVHSLRSRQVQLAPGSSFRTSKLLRPQHHTHRPPPGWLLSTLNFLSSSAQGHMT